VEPEIFANARAAGAEAPTILVDLCGPAEAVPLLQSRLRSFFAACKAVPFQRWPTAEAKTLQEAISI
jgi:hypothetical protein